ncbi:MAG: ribbon-helix-helix domain-containing protein [Candidatus Nanoarchaeia archaeon]|nr:ribbon-helix-helix domain-containing protein [Candidatus Nanoarchaeia archaeon]MDD5740703.1 ribbon-helix-helix domain-containing protein [Candidatus Nanoarchaeia archaeon]
MKQKISITIDEEAIKTIEELLKDSQFRNRSHVIEHSLRKFLEENKK